jgi:hypothetical protein
MRPRLLVALLVAACAMQHEPTASSDARAVDGGAPFDADVDAWFMCGDPMNPMAPETWYEGCPPEGDAFCQHWAQTLTRTGYAHAFCHEPAWTGPICAPGDACPPYFPGATQPPCTCGGSSVCDTRRGEVCVSATPDGPAHCQPACTN